MKTEKIDLYKYFGLERKEGYAGYLTTYIHDQSVEIDLERKRPAMLVISGGGYAYCSFREDEPIAFEFLAKGYNAFTLQYSVKPFSYPVQLIEGAMAVAYIKLNADKLGVDSEHVAGVGFSAGGHLLGMLATLYNNKEVCDALGKNAEYTRLDAVVFSYSVITLSQKTHGGSKDVITGGKQELVDKLSIEKNVNQNSVPAFIWTTVDDTVVPSENSLLLASAYKQAGVPFELHMFEHGWHGGALANVETAPKGNTNHLNPAIAVWTELSNTWLKNRGFIIKN